MYLLPSIVTAVGGIFIVVPISTYYLSAADFGYFAAVQSVMMPFGALANAGVTWVFAARYYSIPEAERPGLVGATAICDFGLKLLLGALFWALAPWLLAMLTGRSDDESRHLFSLLLASGILLGLWPTASIVLVYRGQALVHAVIEIAQWFVSSLTVVVGLIWLDAGKHVLFYGPLAGGVCSFILSSLVLSKHATPRLNRRWLSDIWSHGLPNGLSGLASSSTEVVGRAIIQRNTDLHSLGLYAHSLNYRGYALTLLKTANKSASPRTLATLAKGGGSAADFKWLRIWIAVAAIAWLCSALYGRNLIDYITHGKFADASAATSVWLGMIYINTWGWIYLQQMLVAQQSRRIFVYGLASNLAAVSIIYPLATWNPVVGAAIAIASGSLLFYLSAFFMTRRTISVSLPPTVPLLLFALLVAISIYAHNCNISLPWRLALTFTMIIAMLFWAGEKRLRGGKLLLSHQE